MALFRFRKKPEGEHPDATAGEELGPYRRGDVRADNPIKGEEQDTLSRAPAAQQFARQVLSLDAGDGVVVGVLGPWGSGKTSFLNLARPELKSRAEVLDFNPWMFSGAEHLVDSFFIELAAELKVRDMEDIATAMQQYGEAFSDTAWIPVVGVWLERAKDIAKVAADVLKRRSEGVGRRRAKLQEALNKLDHPIVVILDDIDRLTTQEIRDIFKLVRLTASFPNILYILAFDRSRVERALGEHGLPGRDYLEKILQVSVELPAVPSEVLQREIFTNLDRALDGIEHPGYLDQLAWPDILMELVRPLIRNMRDVRRYASSVRGTVLALEGRIALADVLGMEAIRIFVPDVFARMYGSVEALTSTSGTFGSVDRADHKIQIEELIDSGGERAEVVRCMIQRLFPAAHRYVGGSTYMSDWTKRWLRDRRLAHADYLRLYFERVVGANLQAADRSARAHSLMGDRTALFDYFESIAPAEREDVISGLETYEDEFREEHVVPGCIVLLNLWPTLPERPRGMFGLGTRMVVSRVTFRLLRSLGDPEGVEKAVRAILPELATLSAKLEVIDDVGHRKRVGHKLVTEEVAAQLERAWREEVRNAPVAQLMVEPELLRVLRTAQFDASSGEPRLVVIDDDTLTLALLRNARSEVISQGMESRAVQRKPRLHWKTLVDVIGSEDALRERLAKLERAAGDADLFELADRYLSGWRPEEM